METMKAQIILNFPAIVGWNTLKTLEGHDIINPNIVEAVEYTQGDGSLGSVITIKPGPELKHVVKELICKIEEEEPGRSLTYKVIGGDFVSKYNQFRITMTFSPVTGNEEKQCIYEWKAEFEKKSQAIPSPEKLKDATLKFMKDAETFMLANLVPN